MFPTNHLVDTIASILTKFRISEELDKAWIPWLGTDDFPERLHIAHKATGILELESVVIYTDSAVHRTEVVGMSQHVDKSFSQSI